MKVREHTDQSAWPAAAPRFPDRRRTFYLGGWCLLLTGLLYGTALRLPFFFDDFVHLPYVDANSLAEIWQSAGKLAYYRPLPFTVWKVLYLAGGAHHPVVHHGLNLLLHALNGWLVGLLSLRQRDAHFYRRGILAATLFILFPFSYQAVPWAGALPQILPTTLILLAIFTYHRYGQSGPRRRAWLWLSLFFTVLAPFAHENGVLLGPLVGVLEATRRPWPGWRRLMGRTALWSLPALLWLPLRLAVETGRSAPLLPVGPETLLQNSAYFIQGLGLPLSWLGGWLDPRWPLNDLATAFVLSGLALALSGLLARADDWRRWLRALLWYGLAVVPAALFLPFGYVIDGPRLMMLAAVGSAWLWADAIVSLLQARTRPVLARSAAVLLGAAILLPAVWFVGQRQVLHVRLGETYQQLLDQARAAEDATREMLVVNLPAWLTPERQMFAVGHEGVFFWPDYAFPEALLTTHGVPARRIVFARNDAIRTVQPYRYGIAGAGVDVAALFQRPTAVLVAEYAPRAIDIVPVGRSAVDDTAQGTRFDAPEGPDGGSLLVAADVGRLGQTLTLTFTWTVLTPPPGDTTIFVHVVDSEGRLVAQADGDPLAGILPLAAWPVGVSGDDLRYSSAPPDAVAVRLGLYRRADGLRFLPAGAAAGSDYLQIALP